MSIHTNKLKYISLELDGEEFRAQLRSWRLVPNDEEGDSIYTYGVDGQNEDTEDADVTWTLELSFYADYRSPTGISHWLWVHGGETVAFTIEHNLGSAGEDPQWTGEVKIKKPAVGGEVRTTELTEVTLALAGEPTYVPAA